MSQPSEGRLTALRNWLRQRDEVTRPRVIAAMWVCMSLGLLGTVPLFARPSYEMALAAGILVPAAVAMCTAAELRRMRSLDAAACFARGMTNGAGLAALAFLITLLHGLRAGFCDLSSGAVLFGLGPGVGCLLAGVWGAVAAELPRLPRLARLERFTALLGLLGPLGSALFQLMWFVTTPMIFAYDPFVGFFSGAIFDTVLSYEPLLAYRAASLASLFAVYALACQLRRDSEGALRLRRPLSGLALLGGLAGVISLASALGGYRQNHWHTRGTIAAELGGELRHGRCLMLYDKRLERDHIERMAHDCHQHVLSVEQLLGGGDGRVVSAFVFSNVGQKRRYMGAAHTSVAKPWRSEIYLHDLPYPHRVMRHELVHVLAGAHGRGPFQIAGELGGLLPNPGLIEGIAEAAAPRDSNLGAHQWAAAMRQIKVLPQMQRLLSLAFFGNHSSTSYLAAGSFVSWIQQQYGSKVLSAWYGGASLEQQTGKSWQQLEGAWWQMLDALPLDAAALAEAQQRFDRPSLFGRRCPHVVDALLGEANGTVGSGDVAGAQRRYEQVLELAPGNLGASFGIARCHERLRKPKEARKSLMAMVDNPRLTAGLRMRALERVADLRLRAGDAEAAVNDYRQVRAAVSDEGRLRTLDLKMHYATQPLQRAALVALLIGSDERGANTSQALDLVGRWRSATPDDPVPDYLFARQLLNDRRYRLAAEALDRALAQPQTLPRVTSESLRLRVIAACAQGDRTAAQAFLARYEAHPGSPPQRQLILRGVVERCGVGEAGE